MQRTEEGFMRLAIAEAEKAAAVNEVPIGAVIVLNGEVIASAYNLRETEQNAVAHAELLAIEKLVGYLVRGAWRKQNYTSRSNLVLCAVVQSYCHE